MNIIALVKQTPDTAQLSSRVNGLQLMEEGEARIVNPWDEYTLETGIQLKESHGGQVTLLSLGKAEASEAIKRGLAMGADEAVLVSDPLLEGGDTLTTARVLVAAVNKIEDFDIIVAGRSAVDGNGAAVAVQMAALLNVPMLSYVADIKMLDPEAKTITVERSIESGRETVSSSLPAVVSVVKEINEPRYPSFMGIRKAGKKKFPTWNVADLGLEAGQVGVAGSQVRWPKVDLPLNPETETEIIEGSPEEAAKILADRLMAEKVI